MHHPRDPLSGHGGSSKGNRAPSLMDTRTLRQPGKRRSRSASQGRSKPGQDTPLPPFADKDEGAHSRQHPRIVGTGMGIVY